MIELRPLETLAEAKRDWLHARMHFDFAAMGRSDHPRIGALLVWNDDEFAPFSGFPMHFHSNVEIVTYVLEGAITHEDSLGNKGRIAAAEVQAMSAGTGVRHSEFNAEKTPTRLFQIWLEARTGGTTPRWSSRRFPGAQRTGRLVTLASGSPSDTNALSIDADARVLGANLRVCETVRHELPAGRRAYVVAASGRVELNGVRLAARDGAAVTGERQLHITAIDDTELVLVEVA